MTRQPLALMMPRPALSQSSRAPSARRNEALELDCSARPSKLSGRADTGLAPVITVPGRRTMSDRSSAGFLE